MKKSIKKTNGINKTNLSKTRNLNGKNPRIKIPNWDSIKAKREAKDSVFTDLFSDKKYLLALYQCLFPKDRTCTEEDFEILTLENTLLNGSYNDLGFLVKDKLLILVEAQSSWNPNIPMRMLAYVAHSYREYQIKHNFNMYGSKLERYPFPEFYVVYTGKPLPESHKKLHLKDCFLKTDSFGEVPLDCIVNLIDLTNSSGILTEYISFCTIYNDMVKKYGYTIEAVEETIKICKDSNILKTYLESKEVEVTRILSRVFDQETEVLGWVKALEHERDTAIGERDNAIGERDNAVRTCISLLFEMKFSEEDIVARISKEFNFSYEESKNKILEYKKNIK